MEYELKYVVKVDSYIDKIKVINKLTDSEDYETALKATRALIEATGMVVLAKKYNTKPMNSQLSFISLSFSEKGDEKLSDWFSRLNGKLSYIYESVQIDEEIVENVLMDLDELVGIVLKKYDGCLN